MTPVVTGGIPGAVRSFRWTGNFPPGLRMDPSTGAISGTELQPGTYAFTVTVNDWNRRTSIDLTYTFAPGDPLSIAYTAGSRYHTRQTIRLEPVTGNRMVIGEEYQAEPDLRYPLSLAADAAGQHIYVTTLRPRATGGGPDVRASHEIQVFTRGDHTDAGSGVTTHWELGWFAGLGTGRDDGAVDSHARFNSVASLLLDGQSLLVVDQGNHSIRSINLVTNQVGTLAGWRPTDREPNISGLRDHDTDGRQVKFRSPTRIVRGQNSDEYWILDQEGKAIRQLVMSINALGRAQVAVTTLLRPEQAPPAEDLRARDGQGLPARFNQPFGVAVDRFTADAFVADTQSHTIRQVRLRGDDEHPSGEVTTYAGTLNTPGVATGTQPLQGSAFRAPTELGLDGRARMFVLEDGGTRIRQIRRGRVNVFLNNLPVRPNTQNHIAVRPGGEDPQLLALSCPGAGAADWRVRVLRVGENHVAANLPSVLAGTEADASAVAVEAVQLPAGAPEPRALAFDLDGRLHVLLEDRARQVCQIHTFVRNATAAPVVWDPQGAPVEFGPGAGGALANWAFPRIQAMAADRKGNLFLTDRANGAILVRRADNGQVILLAGAPPERRVLGAQARPFTAALLAPKGIAVTNDDDLVLVDGNLVIQGTAPGNADLAWAAPDGDEPAWNPEEPEDPGAGGAPPPPPADRRPPHQRRFEQGLEAMAVGDIDHLQTACRLLQLVINVPEMRQQGETNLLEARLRLGRLLQAAGRIREARDQYDQGLTLSGAEESHPGEVAAIRQQMATLPAP